MRYTSARIGHFLTSRYVVNICLLSSSRGPVSTDAFRRPTQELSSILFRSWTGIENGCLVSTHQVNGFWSSSRLGNCTWVSRVLRLSALQNQSLSTSNVVDSSMRPREAVSVLSASPLSPTKLPAAPREHQRFIDTSFTPHGGSTLSIMYLLHLRTISHSCTTMVIWEGGFLCQPRKSTSSSNHFSVAVSATPCLTRPSKMPTCCRNRIAFGQKKKPLRLSP